MSSPPTVSILIAAYNAQDTIDQAITSALAQTGVDLEVLVVDDASTDQTAAVVGRRTDRRLTFIRLAQNGGPSAARNVGLKQAKGDWCAVLDADDAMKPDRLQTLIEAAERHKADSIADNMIVERGADTSLFIEELLDGSADPLTLADYALNNRLFERGRGYGYLKPVFRRSFLTSLSLRYEERLRIGEDFYLMAEILAQGGIYIRLRSAGYVYRVAAGSISHRLSAANAKAMVEADRRFMASYGLALSLDDRRAMQRHLISLEHGEAFSRMIDALKSRNLAAFARQAIRRPSALRHFSMPISARLQRAKGRERAPT